MVEWMTHLPMIALGDDQQDADFDRATYDSKDFAKRAQAVAFAMKKCKDASLPIQVAQVIPFEVEKRRGLPDRVEYDRDRMEEFS